MGLLGRYRKKDFDNNTGLFRKQIDLILVMCSSKFVNDMQAIDPTFSLEKRLLIIADAMCMAPQTVGKTDWKQLEVIDSRIWNLLKSLLEDIKVNKPALFMAHIDLLSEAVASRAMGYEVEDAQTLNAKIKVKENSAQLDDLFYEKELLKTKMCELTREGGELDSNDPRMGVIEKKYMEYTSYLHSVEREIIEIRNLLSTNLKILEVNKAAAFYENSKKDLLSSPEQMRQVVAKVNRAVEDRQILCSSADESDDEKS